MPRVNKPLLDVCQKGCLNDYVTAIAVSPVPPTFAIASAAGEILLVNPETQTEFLLQDSNGQSIDCLAFSADGHYLAAGGQSGQLHIWQTVPELKSWANLHYSRTWIDSLAWSPTCNELAFSLGRYAQVWDADAQAVVATLQFEQSSVLDLAWHSQGNHLAVSGHQGIKIWQRDDWDADPIVREMAAASIAIAVSPDGQYLASGNLDHTLLVWPFESEYPWQMRGFPGKVRYLAWSEIAVGQAPLIATASGAAIVVWRKKRNPSDGWDAQLLDLHRQRVNAIAFQPNSTLLASAAEDGWVGLWHNTQQVTQILEGATRGFSCLAWSLDGQRLAAGGQQGEWLIWKQSRRGRGFG